MHTKKAEIVPPSSFSEPSEPSQLRPEDKPQDTLRGEQEENPQLIAHSKGKQSGDRKGTNGSRSGRDEDAEHADETKRADVAGGFAYTSTNFPIDLPPEPSNMSRAGAPHQVQGAEGVPGGDNPRPKRDRAEQPAENPSVPANNSPPLLVKLEQLHTSDIFLGFLKLALESDRETQVKVLRMLDVVVDSMAGRSPEDPDEPGAKRARPEEGPEDALLHSQALEVDRRIIATLKRGFHVPLTLFTIPAIAAVSRDRTLLKTVQLCDVNCEDVMCVDALNWPEEESMQPGGWREAYGYFLEALSQFLPNVEVRRFWRHYEYLVGKSCFATAFDVILRFDISIRSRYFHDNAMVPFEPGSFKYNQLFDDAIALALAAPAPQPKERNDAREVFHPGDYVFENSSDEDSSAEEQGMTPSPGREPSPAPAGPLCFVCARSGHRAAACTRTVLPNGRATYAEFSGGRLLKVANGFELCVSWNAKGRKPCKDRRCSRNSSRHACSFCGSKQHNAASKRCV
ncbi:hypothetical protein OH77DRAFT_1525452 [Trametes cingulata]|nr:hypothetical protein OH77DRAFT_1525452 [Trametes cingulata]